MSKNIFKSLKDIDEKSEFKITDHIYKKTFTNVVNDLGPQKSSEVSNENPNTLSIEQKALKYFSDAETKRRGGKDGQYESAYIYLALGISSIKFDIEVKNANGTTMPAYKLLHFAGHGFREVGQFNRAALAYKRSGIDGINKYITENETEEELLDFNIRSLALAKVQYEHIGQTDSSDEIHILEWHARRMRKSDQWFTKLTKYTWGLTSIYGTSLTRWSKSMGILLVIYLIIYQSLYMQSPDHFELEQDESGETKWVHILTPIYFFITTVSTVGFGDITPMSWLAQITVTTNILLGYGLIAIGLTIIARKVIGR